MDNTVVVTAAILSLVLLPCAWNASRPPGRVPPRRLVGPSPSVPVTCTAPIMHGQRSRRVVRVERAVCRPPCKRPAHH